MQNVPCGLPFLNGWPFKRIWYSFEQLGLSVPKNKVSSVRMAWAICLKKNVICLNGLRYPLEQLGLSV